VAHHAHTTTPMVHRHHARHRMKMRTRTGMELMAADRMQARLPPGAMTIVHATDLGLVLPRCSMESKATSIFGRDVNQQVVRIWKATDSTGLGGSYSIPRSSYGVTPIFFWSGRFGRRFLASYGSYTLPPPVKG